MNLRSRRRLGGLLWVGGVVLAVGWGSMQPDTTLAVPGMARSETFEVAALENGRIETMRVALHDPVAVGDVVVELDPTLLKTLREVTAAEFLAISMADGVDPEKHTDRIRKRASTLQLQTELSQLDRTISSLRSLVAQGAASQSEVDERALERASLVARIRAKRVQAGQPADQEVGAGAWAVVAALKRMEAVDDRLDDLELQSKIQGRVSAVMRHEGEVVRRGDPILRIAQDSSTEVLAFVPAHKRPEVGSGCTIVRADGSRLKGSVISVAPEADLLPESVWTVPRRPERGVTVQVRVTDGTLIPNEPLRVQFDGVVP